MIKISGTFDKLNLVILDSSEKSTAAMKVLILCALFAATQASAVLYGPSFLNTGASTQYRSQDNIGNYHFGYDEGHATGGTFRKETGDALGNKYGSYGLRDADGRVRVVNYVADAAGFRADIKTNEPGVEPKDPASTTINKALVVAPAHAAYAAPAHAAYAVPAHAAYAAPATHYAPSVANPWSYAAPYAHYGYYPGYGLPLSKYGYYGYPV